MNVVILCGGFGTRLGEDSARVPKPVVTVGERPIVWHIMRAYAHYGFDEFVLALGYKADVIKSCLFERSLLDGEFEVHPGAESILYPSTTNTRWRVSLIDTGVDTMTGGRLKRLEPTLGQRGTFMMTYADGVSDIDLRQLWAFHRSHGKLATITAVSPKSQFGRLTLEGDRVAAFSEKGRCADEWINGGFFVFEPEVFQYIDGDRTILEREPLERLARDGQLMAYKHDGFWQCMDTAKDRQRLEDLWATGQAPWRSWVDVHRPVQRRDFSLWPPQHEGIA